MAKPMQFSCFNSEHFPSQKNVYFIYDILSYKFRIGSRMDIDAS